MCVAMAEAPPALGDVEAQPVSDAEGQPTAFPATPGVYAVYAPDSSLQYIGLSRKARSAPVTQHDRPRSTQKPAQCGARSAPCLSTSASLRTRTVRSCRGAHGVGQRLPD